MLDLGGTYRAFSPQQTLEKIEPLLWDKFGITRVANITGLDDINIPTYVAVRPRSKFFSTSQGKGITHDLAKISAMMESIEGWHAENLPKPDLYGSVDSLKENYNLADIEILSSIFFKVPYASLKAAEISWMKGIDLNTGLEIYFPRDLVNLDFVSCNDLDSLGLCMFPPSSNGLASGNTYEEAVCHALYEVIERHCWHKSDFKPPKYIDPASIRSPHIQALMKHLDTKSISYQFLDMTDEINIPTFSATLTDLTGVHAIGSFCGAGAHLSSEVALSRAITEAIQSRLTIIGGSREDIYPSVYRDIRSAAKDMASIKGELFVFEETVVPRDFKACINETLSRLKKAGFEEVIVYDHTRNNLGIPVVHVLISGLQFNVLHHNHYAYSPDELCLI